MKSAVLSLVLPVVLLFSAAAFAESNLEKAQKAYSQRDYNSAGIASAQQAADLYAELVKETADPFKKAEYLALQSEATYFVGNASSSNEVKIAKHWAGYELADSAARETFGLASVSKADVAKLNGAFSSEQLAVLAKVLYNRGTNLGQWGSAKGVSQSLGRWPELRDNMQLIINLGFEGLSEGGPSRTLARGFFKIPSMLGGDTQKAERFQRSAFDGSKDASGKVSINGYNNLFFAEILKYNSKRDEAKAILEAYTKIPADELEKLNPSAIPESRQAQRECAELLKTL